MRNICLILLFSFLIVFADQFGENPADTASLFPDRSAEDIIAYNDSLVSEFYLSATLKTDSLCQVFFKDNRPGASVAVIQNGLFLHKEGYGLAHISPKQLIQPDTKFLLASVSKQFTAMAVMILEEAGKISYDDTIDKYFPHVPDRWKSITIEHLLTHTSGIPDRFYVIGYAEGYVNSQILDRLISNSWLDFTPGRRHKYSNSGYNVLSMIIEQVSGMPFREFMRINIFEPLEMYDTLVYDETEPDLGERAIAYWPLRRGYRPNDFLLYTSGASGIYSNIEDLYKWDQALYTEKLVSAETLERAFSPHARVSSRENYGYGWRLSNGDGVNAVYHTGTLGGIHNILFRVPDENFSVIILSNTKLNSRHWLVRKITEFYHPGMTDKLNF
ncbi:serine hydrolase domain-containing protein [candidate division KSB1 bacterium]